MNALTATLLALLAGSNASAMDLEGQDEFSDPDVVAEVKKAEQSNLENAMAKGMEGAAVDAENIIILMLSARADLRAAARDLRGLPDLEEGPLSGGTVSASKPTAATSKSPSTTSSARSSSRGATRWTSCSTT